MHQETDMTTIVNMLRTAAASISETANWLSQQFGDKPTVPTAPKPAITLEHVRAVLADKSRHGYTSEVKALLHRHGADKLSEIVLKMSRTVQSNLPKDFGKRVSGENHFLKGSLLTD